MRNTYFKFQQFIVHQDNCAMKVCTDACLFGAWVAGMHWSKLERVLDIGTGTGLLSLMFAQKNQGIIDAVEIDRQAYVQAADNFAASSWNNRLQLFHSSIQDFAGKNYDLVIVNPPFFDNDLKSNDEARNIALHSEQLKLEELLSIAVDKLNTDGKMAILLPAHRSQEAEKLFYSFHLYIHQQLVVKQTEKHSSFRFFYLLSKKQDSDPVVTEMAIKNHNRYTESFREWLKDYYLQFGLREKVVESF